MTKRQPGRTAALVAVLLVAAGAATLLISRGGGGGSSGPEAGSCSWGQLLATDSPRWPACHRPYADDSPFNTALSSDAELSPDSKANAAFLDRFQAGSLVFGDPARDAGVAVYTSRPQDPVYTLHCLKPWGTCDIEGMRVRIPAAAKPAGTWPAPAEPIDAHMTVVDPRTKWEYDLWSVRSKPRGGGQLDFAWGGRTKIDGNGLGSAAVAGNYGTLAGPIRAEELIRGEIDHALAISVPCVDGSVYPSTGGSITCAEGGLSGGAGAPPLGARYRLDLSEDEIAALDLPRWETAILRAFSRYGAFVSDTTGDTHWGIEIESPASFTSFGKPDPRIAMAKRLGSPPEDFNHNGAEEFWLYLSDKIDWKRLQVVAPCVSRGDC